MQTWAKISFCILLGYGLLGKTFAYVGVPSAKLFIGDVVLGLFVLLCGDAILRPLLEGMLGAVEFSGLFWAMTLCFFYGTVEFVRGIVFGYPTIIAAEDYIIDVYPLYFFVGLWAAITYPDIIRKYIWYVSWASCLYAIIHFAFLQHVKPMIPGSTVEIFPNPGGGLALVGLTYFDKQLRRWWLPLTVNVLIVTLNQVRAEWLGLSIALTIQGILTGKLRRILYTGMGFAGLLAIGFVADLTVPSPGGRGLTTVSARGIVARALAAVDRDAAAEYDSKNANFYAGTISWRRRWWDAIWISSKESLDNMLIGHGYGFRLNGLVSYLRGSDVRTPHNIFFFRLGYTGWTGVILFFALQGSIGLTMFRVWQRTGQPFGVVFWVAGTISAFFGEFYEAPQGAIPYYLVVGMVSADLLRQPETVTAVESEFPREDAWGGLKPRAWSTT